MKASDELNRGDVWIADLPRPDKARPVVLVSRQEAYAIRDLVTVAYVTTRLRRLRSLVSIGAAEGLEGAGVVNCDLIATISKRLLVERVGSLTESRLTELDEALKFSLGLS